MIPGCSLKGATTLHIVRYTSFVSAVFGGVRCSEGLCSCREVFSGNFLVPLPSRKANLNKSKKRCTTTQWRVPASTRQRCTLPTHRSPPHLAQRLSYTTLPRNVAGKEIMSSSSCKSPRKHCTPVPSVTLVPFFPPRPPPPQLTGNALKERRVQGKHLRI